MISERDAAAEAKAARARTRASRAPTSSTARTGVLIRSVAEGSPAAQRGLRANDVILAVGRTRVASVAEFRSATEGQRGLRAADPPRQRDAGHPDPLSRQRRSGAATTMTRMSASSAAPASSARRSSPASARQGHEVKVLTRNPAQHRDLKVLPSRAARARRRARRSRPRVRVRGLRRRRSTSSASSTRRALGRGSGAQFRQRAHRAAAEVRAGGAQGRRAALPAHERAQGRLAARPQPLPAIQGPRRGLHPRALCGRRAGVRDLPAVRRVWPGRRVHQQFRGHPQDHVRGCCRWPAPTRSSRRSMSATSPTRSLPASIAATWPAAPSSCAGPTS